MKVMERRCRDKLVGREKIKCALKCIESFVMLNWNAEKQESSIRFLPPVDATCTTRYFTCSVIAVLYEKDI